MQREAKVMNYISGKCISTLSLALCFACFACSNGGSDNSIVRYGPEKDINGIFVYGHELYVFLPKALCNNNLRVCSSFESAYWVDNSDLIKLPILDAPTSARSFITMCSEISLRAKISVENNSGYLLDNARFGIKITKLYNRDYEWKKCSLNLATGKLNVT